MGGTIRGVRRSGAGDSGEGNVLAANRMVLLIAVPVFLVLALVAYITVQFAYNERQAEGWVRHSYQVIASLARVRSDLQDAETGQRGYLITRRAQFLIPYSEGRTRIKGHLADFRRLTVDNPYRIDDAEMLQAIYDLVEHEGLVMGGSTGINVVGAIRLAKQLGPGKTIVTILCDSGNRYQSKLFNPDFMRSKNLPVPTWLEKRSKIDVPFAKA